MQRGKGQLGGFGRRFGDFRVLRLSADGRDLESPQENSGAGAPDRPEPHRRGDGAQANCKPKHTLADARLVSGDTKTGRSTRKIVLPQSAAQLLRERKKAVLTEWISPHPLGPERPTSPASAYNHLKPLLKAAGPPGIRAHGLRYTFTTTSLEHGMDGKPLSAVIGHVLTATCGRGAACRSGRMARSTPAMSAPTTRGNVGECWPSSSCR